MKLLPSTSSTIIKGLFEILHEVARNSAETKMKEETLAIIFSGFLLPLSDITQAPLTNRVTSMLIRYQDRIFDEVRVVFLLC
jgi:hypothetical protein